jgi:hypothetical protein
MPKNSTDFNRKRNLADYNLTHEEPRSTKKPTLSKVYDNDFQMPQVPSGKQRKLQQPSGDESVKRTNPAKSNI